MARKRVSDTAESKINEAYARAAEKATGIKPMSDDPKYKDFGKTVKKTTTKKSATKKPAAKKPAAKKTATKKK